MLEISRDLIRNNLYLEKKLILKKKQLIFRKEQLIFRKEQLILRKAKLISRKEKLIFMGRGILRGGGEGLIFLVLGGPGGS